jgi:hypothetical protein
LPLRDAVSQADAEVVAVLRSSSARWRYPVTRSITPTFKAFADAVCRAQARQRTTRSGIAIAALGMLIFIPQIIKSLGSYSNMTVGWLTMIPYICGAIAMVVWRHGFLWVQGPVFRHATNVSQWRRPRSRHCLD